MEKNKYKMGKLAQFMEMTETSSPKLSLKYLQNHLTRKRSSSRQNV